MPDPNPPSTGGEVLDQGAFGTTEVDVKEVEGGCGVAPPARLEQASVFVVGVVGATEVVGVEHDVRGDGGVEDLDHREPTTPFGGAIERPMEAPVGIGGAGVVEQGLFGLGEIDERQPVDAPFEELGFERPAEREVLDGVGDGEPGDEGATVGLEPEEPEGGEALERFADRDLAHPEAGGHLVLPETEAGRQIAPQQFAHQFALDPVDG